MFKKLTLSAILAVILATTISAAFAGPKQKRHNNTTVPTTGAESWQDRGIAEDSGSVYRRRR
jgi:hypothetical protein